MYIDVSSSSSAPQLNILVNDIPIVQVACVLCRASASIDSSLSQHLETGQEDDPVELVKARNMALATEGLFASCTPTMA